MEKVTGWKNLAQHEKKLSIFRSDQQEQEAWELPLKVKSIHTGALRPSVGRVLEEIPVQGGRGTPLGFFPTMRSFS